MKGAVIATGGELLQGLIQDTNSSYCNGVLVELGFTPVMNMVVGDDVEDIIRALDLACSKASLVILSGGLGPTEDDVTREALARFCVGVPLEFHQRAWQWIQERLEARKTIPREDHKRQAYFPKGAVLFPNREGTAWGFALSKGGRWIVALPGIPRELKSLMENEVIPFVRGHFPYVGGLQSILLRSFGLKESEVNNLLKDLIRTHPNRLGLMVREYGEIHVRIVGPPPLAEDLAGQVKGLLGDDLYGDGKETLEGVVGRLMRERGLTISTAESCTGGMLAHTITNVPGSSDYFTASFVTYTDDMKHRFLGVPKEVLDRYTAVSKETAHHMVEGLVERTRSDLGISVTGIAGPMGGDQEKPVGLVYIGFHSPQETKVNEYRFFTDRLGVKTMAVKTALDIVRRYLLGL